MRIWRPGSAPAATVESAGLAALGRRPRFGGHLRKVPWPLECGQPLYRSFPYKGKAQSISFHRGNDSTVPSTCRPQNLPGKAPRVQVAGLFHYLPICFGFWSGNLSCFFGFFPYRHSRPRRQCASWYCPTLGPSSCGLRVVARRMRPTIARLVGRRKPRDTRA
jgi:hypothetical protein